MFEKNPMNLDLFSITIEFSLKVKVMGSNPGYLLKYFFYLINGLNSANLSLIPQITLIGVVG